MKLYIFSSVNGKISREEKEVIEKNKIFVEKVGISERHYAKNMLDVPETTISSVSMISLNGRIDHFAQEVLKAQKNEIDKLERKLAEKKNTLIRFKMNYAGVLECRVENGIYNAVSTLEFKYNGNMVSATKESVENKTPVQIPLHHIVDGELFFEMMEEHPFLSVYNIFVNGNATNLALEGYENGKENECVISMEKLKKMHEKTKLEIDCE